jgi:hypothetical protein
MTIALQLDPNGYSALEAEARALGLTPEQLANEIVNRHLRARLTSTATGNSDPVFKSAFAASMNENEELLRRLAK